MQNNVNTIDITKPDRDLSKLCPQFKEMVLGAINELQLMGHDVDIYEAYRSPERQEYLFQSGRSRPGPIVTNARAWQSAHNVSLACDLIAKVDGKWTWSEDKAPYREFRKVYKKHGLELLDFEDAHVQFISPFTNEDLKKFVVSDYVRICGMEALWGRCFP